jgi:hypothetical protein
MKVVERASNDALWCACMINLTRMPPSKHVLWLSTPLISKIKNNFRAMGDLKKDSKLEDKGSKESPKNSPPQSPRENRLPPMGDQLQERKIGELCTPDIIDLPILNLEEIGRPFEIKTSIIRMVQHSPFTGKEDPNLHLQAFIQLCQTFNMDRVTQDQMRARLFPFSLLRKVL